MLFWEVILIAVGLSMDTFAVSIMLGLSVKKPKIIEYFIPALYFGFFQTVMPLTGYFAGTLFAVKIQRFDHWIAFILLAFIGGRMIHESFSKEEEKVKENSYRFVVMVLLAIATSIDSLVVGLTFAFLKTNIYFAIAIIGIITFCIAVMGVRVGHVFGRSYKSKAEFIGGAILVMLGMKILIEHLFIS